MSGAENVERLLDELCESADAEFVPAVAAEKLAAELREHAPDDLADWLDERATVFLREGIRERMRARRTRAFRRASARAFGKAVAEDDLATLGHFAVFHVVDGSKTQKPVGEMTGDDHRFVADSYQASGNHDLMLAAFHRQVAKTVGKRRTADVMSEEQYDALLQSLIQRMSA